ncbi:conserved hypothetical protein [Bacillus sp. 349Y]|nr:conserved hypothetical protein [Bacillus sp. 349Y]
MLVIKDLHGKLHNLTNVQEVKRSSKVNGEKSIEISVLPHESNAHAWGVTENETKVTFDNEEYVIKLMNRKGVGSTEVKSLDAVHTFFNTMINCMQYDIHNGSMTFNAALQKVFGPTPYNFNIVDSFLAQSFENFGRENCLSLFQKVLERYGAEFRVSGNIVYLHRRIGSSSGFRWDYKANLKGVDEESNTQSLATVIRGYYGEPNDDSDYPMEVEYRSPHIEEFGELHAEPDVDERVTDTDTADRRLKERLIDEPQLSQTIDFIELQEAGYNRQRPIAGDWGYLFYPPMNMAFEARIVEIVETFKWYEGKWQITKTEVTLSNERRTLSDMTTRFENTSKSLDRIKEGTDRVPFSVVDDAIKQATRALQSAQTELEFNNGINAREKSNANKLVVFNSAGLGISVDGGQTFRTAITAEGIVADVITAGQLNANNVSIFGGDTQDYTYIQGSLIEARGRHTRTWRGQTETNQVRLMMQDGYFRARNDTLNRSLYLSDFGISTYADAVGNNDASGTIAFRDKTYSTANGLTVHSVYGVVALKSEENRVILDSRYTINLDSDESSIYLRPMKTSRPGINEFRFWIKDNGSPSDTDGVLTYGSPNTNYAAGIRFQKTSVGPATVYLTNGNGDMGTGSLNCWDIQANSLRTTNIDNGRDFYIGVSTGELRVTNNLFWNNGNPGYKAVRASEFNPASSGKYKTNITPFQESGVDIVNDHQVFTYHLIADLEARDYSNMQIGFISEASPMLRKGESISLYKVGAINWKATQELSARVVALEKRLNDLEMAV